MFEKILLIPGPRGADEPAFKRVLNLTASSTADIEVFDPVYEPLLEGYFGDNQIYELLRMRLVAERLESAQQLAEALKAKGHNASAEAAWDHPPDRAIARRANARDVDLVVTQPLEGHRAALSHADWQLVAKCPAPVLVVKSEARSDYAKIVAAVDPIHAHAKPAELDEAILAHAKSLQAALGAELEVLHCFAPLSELSAGEAGGVPLVTAEKALEDARRHALESLVAEAGLPVSVIRLEAGKADVVLNRLIDDGEADLVIMGALSRGRLKDFVIGSTAERVLHGGHGDVLTVRPTELPAAV